MSLLVGSETFNILRNNVKGELDEDVLKSTVNGVVRKLTELIDKYNIVINAPNTIADVGTIKALAVDTGAITITQGFHSIDGPATVTSIVGGKIGDLLILQASVTGDDVDITASATIKLQDAGSPFTLSDVEDKITLIKANSTTWHEIARSDNAA